MSEITICMILQFLRTALGYGYGFNMLTLSVTYPDERVKYFSGTLDTVLDVMYDRLAEEPGDDWWRLVALDAYGYEEITQHKVYPLRWKEEWGEVRHNDGETDMRHAETLWRLIKQYLEWYEEAKRIVASQYSQCYAEPHWTIYDTMFDEDVRIQKCRMERGEVTPRCS